MQFEEGYYIKGKIQGSAISRKNFGGSRGENSDMHDHLTYKFGKLAYYLDCHKRLFKPSNL